MTEVEKIAYARSFIDKLAKGINPLDNTPIPDGDVAKNERLSKCFSYVSDILRQVCENGGVTPPRRMPGSEEEKQDVQSESDKNSMLLVSKHNSVVEKEPEEEKKSCMNCRFQVSGECSSWDLCDDYQPVYRVSQAEMAYWPKEGDATRFKRKWKGH